MNHLHRLPVRYLFYTLHAIISKRSPLAKQRHSMVVSAKLGFSDNSNRIGKEKPNIYRC